MADFRGGPDDPPEDPDDSNARIRNTKKSGRHFFRDLDGHDRHDRSGQMSSPKSRNGQNGLRGLQNGDFGGPNRRSRIERGTISEHSQNVLRMFLGGFEDVLGMF